MSMAEITNIIEKNMPVYRDQSISAAALGENTVRALSGSGIDTVGALLDTDAFRAVTSGRYDIDRIQDVNGIPIAALRWLMEEIGIHCEDEVGIAV